MALHGRVFGEIGEDEPTFTIRAADRVAPQAVAEWARLARLAGAAPEIVASAMRHAAAMEAWQAANGSKVPDLK